MTFRKTGKGYIIRMFKGEKVIETLTKFCEKENIRGAYFHGLGAVSEAEFGYYDLSKKEYAFTKYNNMMEVVSMTGNVALFKGDTVLHVHGIFSDTENKTLGGHIKEAMVGVTVEVHVTDCEERIERKYDEEIGLNLMELGN